MYLNWVHRWIIICPWEQICVHGHVAWKAWWENIRTVVGCGMYTENPANNITSEVTYMYSPKTDTPKIKSLIRITEVKVSLFHINKMPKIIHQIIKKIHFHHPHLDNLVKQTEVRSQTNTTLKGWLNSCGKCRTRKWKLEVVLI